MNFDEEELAMRARIRQILDEQIKGGSKRKRKPKRRVKKKGGQHYTQGTHWGTGYSGGTAGWIKFVKKVQKDYGITYKEALKKASKLRKAGKMDPYYKRKFKRRGPGRPRKYPKKRGRGPGRPRKYPKKKGRGAPPMGGDLVHMVIDALEAKGVPVTDFLWHKVITPIIKFFLPPNLKKLLYGSGAKPMTMKQKKAIANKIADKIKKLLGRGAPPMGGIIVGDGKRRPMKRSRKIKPVRRPRPKRPKRGTKWIQFVKKVHRSHPMLSFKDAMSYASTMRKRGGYLQSGIGMMYGEGPGEKELIGDGMY